MASKGQKPAKAPKLDENNGGSNHQQEAQIEEALNAIKALQEKLGQIDEQFTKELLALEAKSNQKRKPLYDERRKVLNKIPHFWTTCLVNIANQLISDTDMDVLRELKDVNVEVAPDVKSGFTLSFTFNKNQFFEPETISKQYLFTEEAEVPKVITTKINWKKDPRKKNKPAPKSSKKRSLEETETISFFDFLESDGPEFLEVADAIKEAYSDPMAIYLQDDEDEEGEDDEEGASDTKRLLESFGEDDDDDDGDFDEAAIAQAGSDEESDGGDE